jgi:RNA polymerase sigma-70 factor (ECF subfamily)
MAKQSFPKTRPDSQDRGRETDVIRCIQRSISIKPCPITWQSTAQGVDIAQSVLPGLIDASVFNAGILKLEVRTAPNGVQIAIPDLPVDVCCQGFERRYFSAQQFEPLEFECPISKPEINRPAYVTEELFSLAASSGDEEISNELGMYEGEANRIQSAPSPIYRSNEAISAMLQYVPFQGEAGGDTRGKPGVLRVTTYTPDAGEPVIAVAQTKDGLARLVVVDTPTEDCPAEVTRHFPTGCSVLCGVVEFPQSNDSPTSVWVRSPTPDDVRVGKLSEEDRQDLIAMCTDVEVIATDQSLRIAVPPLRLRDCSHVRLMPKRDELRLATTIVEQFECEQSAHVNKLLWFAKRWLGSSVDAEDVVQETLVDLWRMLRDGNDNRKYQAAYLFSMLRNKCGAILKKRLVRPGFRSLDQVDEMSLHDDADPGFDSREYASYVATYLQSLSQEEKECLVLSLDDISMLTIAEMLEIPEGTAKSKASRARVKLRQLIINNPKDHSVEKQILREQLAKQSSGSRPSVAPTA